MTVPLPSLLVVDERLARDHAARAAFMEKTGLSPSRPNGDKAVDAPIGFVEFCSGQRDDGKGGWVNDYPTIKSAVADDTDALSLVLLNARLRTHADDNADDFGERVFWQLAEDFPSVPVIQFTSKLEKHLGREVSGKYLYKPDLDRRAITKALLRHGRLSPPQRRALLGLDDFTIAEDSRLLQVFSEAYAYANKDTPVLLLGETGVGKEVVANYIHRSSHRQKGPFKGFNMTAISPDLTESALFGHTKGSFTGATSDYAGFFEQAHGGTLFFDEIGDMPVEQQVKLLRAIQQGEITKIGAKEVTKVSVRLISATSRNLPAAMGDGRFRADFYHRLAGVVLTIPPLRERPADIPALAVRFLSEELVQQRKKNIEFHDRALEALKRHDFPGNVRDLRNLVHRLVGTTGSGRTISEAEVRAELARTSLPKPHSIAITAATVPVTSSTATLRHLLDAIDGYEPRMNEIEGAKPALEAAVARLLGRLAETAMTRYRRVDGKYNVMGAMSSLAGKNLTGTQARQVLNGILKDIGVEAVAPAEVD
jgi:DNA-binding NtrC family response regulator